MNRSISVQAAEPGNLGFLDERLDFFIGEVRRLSIRHLAISPLPHRTSALLSFLDALLRLILHTVLYLDCCEKTREGWTAYCLIFSPFGKERNLILEA